MPSSASERMRTLLAQVSAVSAEEKKPDKRFIFFYEGGRKIIFEPNEEMVKAMQFAAPRKVFKD